MRRNPLSHIFAFWRYYTSARPVTAESAYSLEETKERLLALNVTKEVYVRVNRRNELLLCATAHAVASRGSPIIPELRAQLEDEGGRVVLKGQLGLNLGIRLPLAIFLGMLVLLWVMPGGKESFPGAMILAFGIVMGILVFAYAYGIDDVDVIERRLSEAIGRPAAA